MSQHRVLWLDLVEGTAILWGRGMDKVVTVQCLLGLGFMKLGDRSLPPMLSWWFFSEEETCFLVVLLEVRNCMFPQLWAYSLLDTEEADIPLFPFNFYCPPVYMGYVLLCVTCLKTQRLEPLCNTEVPSSLCWWSSAVWSCLRPLVMLQESQPPEGSNELIIKTMQVCGCSWCRALPRAHLGQSSSVSM